MEEKATLDPRSDENRQNVGATNPAEFGARYLGEVRAKLAVEQVASRELELGARKNTGIHGPSPKKRPAGFNVLKADVQRARLYLLRMDAGTLDFCHIPKRGRRQCTHSSIFASVFMPCWISASSLARSARILFGVR